MNELLSWGQLILSLVSVILLLLVLSRIKGNDDVNIESVVREEFRSSRAESAEHSRSLREEVSKSNKGSSDSMIKTIGEMQKVQQESIDKVEKRVVGLIASNENRLDKLRETLDKQIKALQKSNEKKLEEMRQTVDEKLQSTLEKRLGESFKMVGERLEAVHRGLGEMQELATGVGDLKRVLTNVKTRGGWGEVQLGSILEQILTPEQYASNVQPKPGSSATVEFAIKLPGHDDGEGPVWIPIDAKFPREDYERLQDAAEKADKDAVDSALKGLRKQIIKSARDISEKYLSPPQTTDFGIMFLPTEGLYAEVLRLPGLTDLLQTQYRIMVAGPTTFAALLNSLRMGFRTLAIEKQSSEVWRVLGAVKTEFAKFGDVLDKVKRQLNAASNTIDASSTRTRAMERKLREVEQLPENESIALLGIEDVTVNDDAETD
ncbi:MAG: DNA recombination protein RmuC [Xanthomonadales bacterium]